MSVILESIGQKAWLVTVSGRLDHSQTPEFEEELNRLLNQGADQLVIDLAGVTYINSGGLRCLVTVWRRIRKNEGKLVLCSLSDRVTKIFDIVGFDKVFEVYPGCEEAKIALHIQ